MDTNIFFLSILEVTESCKLAAKTVFRMLGIYVFLKLWEILENFTQKWYLGFLDPETCFCGQFTTIFNLQNDRNWSFLSNYGYKRLFLSILEVTESCKLAAKTGFRKLGIWCFWNYEKSDKILHKHGIWGFWIPKSVFAANLQLFWTSKTIEIDHFYQNMDTNVFF